MIPSKSKMPKGCAEMDIFSLGGRMAGLAVILLIFYLALIALMIVCIVLFIKVTTRGIKALDIYIGKNSRPYFPGPQNYNYGQQYLNQNPRPTSPPDQNQEK